MNRYAYYQDLKLLAREVRTAYGLNTPRVLRSDLRRIYKTYGIRIDLWPAGRFKNVRGAYFDDEMGTSVVIAGHLPEEPMIFTMGHELKHHLKDRNLGIIYCSETNDKEPIEIGAEVFAAELIFPDQDFIDSMNRMGIAVGKCTPEALVRLKRESKTTLSYAGLVKKTEFLGFASAGSFAKVAWKKLEEEIYGEPIYKRLKRMRAMAARG